MRNYICDVCGQSFELSYIQQNKLIKGVVPYRIMRQLGFEDICYSCECRLSTAIGNEINEIMEEFKNGKAK